MDLVFQIIQFVVSLLEIGLCNQLLYLCVFERGAFSKKEKAILVMHVLVVGSLLAINRNILFFSNGMMIVAIILGSICAIYVERSKKFLCVLVVMLYHFCVSLFDFFFAFISMIFLKQDFEQAVFWHTNSAWKCGIYIVSRVVITMCIWFIGKKKKTGIKMADYREMIIVVDVVLCFLITQYHIKLEAMSAGTQNMEGGITSLSLLSVVLVIFCITVLVLKNRAIQKENEFLMLRDEMIQHNFWELERSYEQSHRLIHDIKNHFLILKDYEKQKDYVGLHKYLEEIENSYKEIRVCTWTGNRIVDLMIGQKKEMAEQYGIEFLVTAIPISHWQMNDSELCSLFGNLLDNAIEACQRIEHKEKQVYVNIEKQGRLIFIKVKNTIEEIPVMKNGRPISSKGNKKKHGYGIKNIDRIVNKYEGEILYQVLENHFQVSITLFNNMDVLSIRMKN